MFYSLDKSLLYPEERRFIPLSGHRYKIFVYLSLRYLSNFYYICIVE